MDNINNFLNVQYKMNASNFIISNQADFVFNFVFHIYSVPIMCQTSSRCWNIAMKKIPYSYGIHIASAIKKSKAGKKAEGVKNQDL